MPDVSVQQFPKYFEKEELSNLYLFWGPETYFHDVFVTQLEKKVIPDAASKDFNFHSYYANDVSINEVVSTCLSFPMMSDRKLVIVKHFDKITIDDKDAFIKYIQNPQKSTVLVLTAETWGKTKFHTELLKAALSVNCKTLYEREVYSWVKSKFDERKIKIEENSIAFLVENIGHNLLRLNVEIEKLSNFATEGQELSLKIISEITGFSRDVNVFNFQNELGKKKLNNALQIGLKLLEQGESLASIFPMVFLFFKRMWVVKEMLKTGMGQKQIVSELGGSPYYYKDIFNSHKKFSTVQLKNIFINLEQSDILLKTSQKRDESILTMIIYNICKI
jgi:DNA polymerase III subunit delta